MVLLNKCVFNKIKEKRLIWLILLIAGLFLALEIITVAYFKVQYNWDFKCLMESAMRIATSIKPKELGYFKVYPNNIGALIIVTIVLKIFGGNVNAAYALNIVLVFLSFIFAVLSANKIGGIKLALNTAIVFLLTAPIYLYTPIIYTDTLSIAFPVMTLYFWLLMKQNKDISKIKYYLSLVAMVIASCIGFCVKPVAAIIFVAIIIDSIFTHKKIVKDILIAIVLFVVLVMSYNKVTAKVILRDNRKNDMEIPTTHWIMMGLGKPESDGGTAIGYGSYSQRDVDFTITSGNYSEKREANIKKIKERLRDFGVKGYICFLYQKGKYIWNDGTYYSLKLIGWDTLNKSSVLYQYVLGEKSEPFVESMTYWNNIVFVLIVLGFAIKLKRKENVQEFRVLGISIVGIAMFLLLWEARSRYVYFLIPVFCLLAAMGLTNIINIMPILKNKIINRKELKSNE